MEMTTPSCTRAEVLKLIENSGYPFELNVAALLQARGYDVKLSHHFFNPLRQQDSELDILASREITCVRQKARNRIRCILELAIECKDNSLPYVLFGFPSPKPPPESMLDTDCYYIKTRSTDDDIPNKLCYVALGDSRIKSSTKRDLHQFAEPFRFHQATAVEIEKSKLKLHATDRLRTSLGGLVGYLEYIQDTWQNGKKALESGMSYDPTIWINFFLLIHNGDHFRYTNEKALEVATHTTLFTSFHSDTASVPLAIDFVKYKDLEAALKQIEASFDVLYKHLGLYVKPSPRPAEQI